MREKSYIASSTPCRSFFFFKFISLARHAYLNLMVQTGVRRGSGTGRSLCWSIFQKKKHDSELFSSQHFSTFRRAAKARAQIKAKQKKYCVLYFSFISSKNQLITTHTHKYTQPTFLFSSPLLCTHRIVFSVFPKICCAYSMKFSRKAIKPRTRNIFDSFRHRHRNLTSEIAALISHESLISILISFPSFCFALSKSKRFLCPRPLFATELCERILSEFLTAEPRTHPMIFTSYLLLRPICCCWMFVL